MSTIERLPPHSIDAEEAVLGSLLIDPDAIFDVANFLRPPAFYKTQNRWIYEAILALSERREPIDFITLLEELRRREKLEEVGGEAYVIDLINAVPTSVNARSYAHVVEAAAMRRKMLSAASTIAELAYDEAEDVNIVIDRAEQALFSISEERTTRDLVPIRQIANSYLDRIQALQDKDSDIIGVPTGFTDLDRLLGGLNKSDLLIFAGRPGMGKTSFQNSLALTAALKHGKRIAIFNLEMSGEQLVQRMIAAETKIDSQRLRRGQLQDHEWPIFMEAVGRLSEARIFIDDTPSITTNQLRTKCRRLYAEHGLDLIMIDYLQLMSAERSSNNRVMEISEISRGLKGLARELDVPVLAAAQLSRAVEQRQDKRPLLSDLRDSGCLSGDTLITLADDGSRVPIKSVVGQSGFNIWALNQDTYQLEKATVSNAFSTGVKQLYTIKTQLGRTIRATANHKFLTIDGWKRLDELVESEHIALPRLMPSSQSPSTLSNEQMALIGHLIGDGCTLPGHVLQYTTREYDLAEKVVHLTQKAFGSEISPRIHQEKSWYQVYLTSTRQHTHGIRNAIAEWFDELGIWGLRSYEKFVPEAIFAQSSESIALFLRHLWSTDGCVRMVWGKSPRPAIYYATSSLKLAQNVQSLLLRFEILARVKSVPQAKKGRQQYHVIISGQSDVRRFIEKIGAVGRYKQKSLQEIAEFMADKVENTNRDIIPKEVWLLHVKPAMSKVEVSHRQLHAEIGTAYSGMTIFNQNLSRERAVRVATAVDSEPLHHLAQSAIYWDKIASITQDGIEEVFDLTVPGNHNFVANDIIVHNSIEQDADIVMFIYRDEYYNPETTERPNIAEVNIAKHRNGPTGTIDLYWHGKLATFRNLARQEISL